VVSSLTNEAIPRRVIDIAAVPQAVSMIVGNGIALAHPVEAMPSASPMAAEQQHVAGDGGKLVEPAS
jgi:hypothetical protein